MAKYIDLLRKHQKKAETPENFSPTPLTETRADQSHEELEMMLQDESTLPVTEFSVDAPPPNSDLIAEDTIEAHIDSDTGIAKKLNTTDNQTTESDSTIISNWLTDCVQLVSELFTAACSNSITSIDPLSIHLNELLKKVSDEDSSILDTLELEISRQIKQIGQLDSDLGSLIRKSIMMMLYAIKMGCRLKLDTDELRSHTMAAMIHHIGMAQIPSEIRNKKERLTKDELNEIRTASAKSHEYLNQCNITDTAILHAASQAQERYDGSGPQALSGSDITYSARMISLLSMFEALIHYRPYRNRLLPRDAIRELVNHHKKAFDPIMLKALIESISLYPVGTYVQLNSGDVGLVIQVRPRLPLRPLVLIKLDSQGGEVPQREVDLQGQPNLMVQSCMYEENLSELKESSEKDAR